MADRLKAFGALVIWGVLSLSVLWAQEQLSFNPQRTGLIPLDAKQVGEIIRTWPRISKVNVNWLGIERINRSRAQKGMPPLGLRSIKPVGQEVEASIGLLNASSQGAVAASDLVGTLPAFVDNSTLPYFPPIRNQGSLGSCGSFATTYYQLSYMTAFQRGLDIRDGNNNTNKYSPKWSYNMINGGSDSGSTFSTNYNLLSRHGASTWAEFPYDGDYRAWCLNSNAWRNALSVRTRTTQYVYSASSESGLATIKELLNNGYVLVFGTFISSWKVTQISDDQSTPDDNSAVGKTVGFWLNGAAGSHAMTIVGYNDAIWTDVNSNGVIDPGEKGAFRIANSWGPSWGDGGFIWLAYDALRNPSAVSGAPSTGRMAAFQSDIIFVLTARDDYSPTMVAEFTVNHAKRGQLALGLGFSDTSHTSPTSTWTPYALDYQGGAYAFDGTTTAIDGTFVFDFSDLIGVSGIARRYYLGMSDNISGDVATLKSFKIIDTTTDPDTEIVSSQVPQSVDNGGAVYSYIDYTYSGPTSNHAPSLSNGKVVPPTGTVAGTYTFYVDYYDSDTDAPAVMTVYVDENPYAMVPSAGPLFSTTYNFQTTLSVGTHTFRFHCEDGRGEWANDPIAGTYTGPFVTPTHYVTAPHMPSGETHPVPNSSFTYTASGSSCNLGESIQYRFNWGDGRESNWLNAGQASADHSWSVPGSYAVTTQARCAVNTAIVSSWSDSLTVTVANSSAKVDFNNDGREDILWRYYGSGGYNRAWFLGNSEVGTSDPSSPAAEMKPGHPGGRTRRAIDDVRKMSLIAAQRRTPDPKAFRDIMGDPKERGGNPAMISDPREAGGGNVMPSRMSIIDPRQMNPNLQGKTSSDAAAKLASTPSYLGGGDVLPVSDPNWQIVGTGDFNNDTHIDILWRYNGSSGANVVWYMNGTDWSGSAVLIPVPDLNWKIVGTGDFNNDTHVDILWRNSVTGSNVVWYMNGTQRIGSAVLLGVSDPNWQIVGTGDFNNDTHVDILWRNGAGGYNVVWYMQNAAWTGSAELISVGDTAWQIAGTGDYNGDGRVDILWRYYGAGGYNVIWYMNGVSWSSSADLISVGDLSWRIVSR